MRVLAKVDDAFAELGVVIIVPLRKNYASTVDEIIPVSKMLRIHEAYEEFCVWTSCKTIRLYVDEFYNDLKEEIQEIKKGLKDVEEFGFDFSIRRNSGFSRGNNN
jgi:hypothetical protein